KGQFDRDTAVVLRLILAVAIGLDEYRYFASTAALLAQFMRASGSITCDTFFKHFSIGDFMIKAAGSSNVLLGFDYFQGERLNPAEVTLQADTDDSHVFLDPEVVQLGKVIGRAYIQLCQTSSMLSSDAPDILDLQPSERLDTQLFGSHNIHALGATRKFLGNTIGKFGQGFGRGDPDRNRDACSSEYALPHGETMLVQIKMLEAVQLQETFVDAVYLLVGTEVT